MTTTRHRKAAPRRKPTRRRSRSLTPKSVKAQSDRLSDQDQMRLFYLYVGDANSKVGAHIRGHLGVLWKRGNYYQMRAGVDPASVDPHRLTATEETDKAAKRRTGKRSTNAVKTARHEARQRAKRAIPPPFHADVR
jgi:hypothetical protein